MFKTKVRKQLLSWLSLVVMAGCFLGLSLAFVPAPLAHADSCTVREAYENVYDSYDHLEGVVSLHRNVCNATVWGTFLSNANTWKTVHVYTELETPGYTEATYGWAANTNFNAPPYSIAFGACYYAEVDLIDNKGVNNWFGTSFSYFCS